MFSTICQGELENNVDKGIEAIYEDIKTIWTSKLSRKSFHMKTKNCYKNCIIKLAISGQLLQIISKAGNNQIY
jgi:hypothetical protein